MNLINIGYGNMISAKRIIAVASPDSAPIKRLVAENKDSGFAIDATHGRKTKSVIIMDSGHIILSSLITETVARRVNGEDNNFETAESEGEED